MEFVDPKKKKKQVLKRGRLFPKKRKNEGRTKITLDSHELKSNSMVSVSLLW